MPLYLSQHRVPSVSLVPGPASWPPAALFSHQAASEARIASHALRAEQVGPTWRRRCIPVLSLSGEGLLIGAGGDVLAHAFLPRKGRGVAPLAPAVTFPLSDRSDADVVGLHALPGGGGAIVAQFDGTLRRLDLRHGRTTAHYDHPRGGEHIYALSGAADAFMALSLGVGRMYAARSPWIPPVEFAFEGRPWSGLLTEAHAYVGLRGEVRVHSLKATGPVPLLSLRPPGGEVGGGVAVIDSLDALDAALGRTAQRSAPYSVAVRGNTVLSAWHDGVARLHDLRTGECEAEFRDPWQDAPLYCAQFLGERAIAAGGGQHGLVAVFDVRAGAPSARRGEPGWSVFSPAGTGSPVYALASDGPRLWGVSERRAFVLSFEAEDMARTGPVGGRRAPWPNGTGGWRWPYTAPAQAQACMGYRHAENGTQLFETLVR